MEGVTKAESNIISHSSSNVSDRVCSGAIRGRDRYAFKLDSARGAISKRDGGGDTRAVREERKEGLKRKNESGGQRQGLLDGLRS